MDEGTGSAVSQSALWSTVPIREERHPPASRSDADKHCGRVDDALAKSAWDYYTEWPAFRAASCRRSCDRSGSAPSDTPRSRQAATHLYNGRYCPLSIRVTHLFSRMFGQQLLDRQHAAIDRPAHSWRNELLRVDRRAFVDGA